MLTDTQLSCIAHLQDQSCCTHTLWTLHHGGSLNKTNVHNTSAAATLCCSEHPARPWQMPRHGWHRGLNTSNVAYPSSLQAICHSFVNSVYKQEIHKDDAMVLKITVQVSTASTVAAAQRWRTKSTPWHRTACNIIQIALLQSRAASSSRSSAGMAL
jgi:hypothetical protein